MTPTTRTPSMTLLKRLLSIYVEKYRFHVMLAMVCMVITAGTTAATAWMIKPALDEVFLNKDLTMLYYICGGIVGIFVLKAVAEYGETVLLNVMGQRVVTTMQLDLYEHLLHADIGLLSKEASGQIISRFTNDIQLMRHAVSTALTSFIKQFLTLFFLIGLLFYHSVVLATIAIIVFPVAVVPVVKLSKRMRKISGNMQTELGKFTKQLDETFSGIRIIKAYHAEAYEISRAKMIVEKLIHLYTRAARTQAVTSPLMELLGGIAAASVIWYGGMQVIEGSTTPGTFISFIVALIQLYTPIKSLSSLNVAIQDGFAAANRMFHLFDIKPVVATKAGAKPLKVGANKALGVTLEDVDFMYDAKPTLQRLSLEVPPGKTVALVGASGGGKSTIISLILRFFDVDKGRILIDGTDIRELTLPSLRKHVSLVTQDVVLFDDTVRNNLRYGSQGASDVQMIQAAKDACAHEFIMELPQGYDTPIGQKGFKLSGGQRQRLAIARAMLKNAPILLLDEATSALDNVSERIVQTALNHLMKGRTTLVVAHRLSTIMDADIIYVINKGAVIEKGTHDSLLKAKGAYCKLYTRQHTQ